MNGTAIPFHRKLAKFTQETCVVQLIQLFLLLSTRVEKQIGPVLVPQYIFIILI